MKKIILTSFVASLILFSYSCKNDFETDVADIQVTSGNADFSRYVALGNSLTSGFRDGALYSDAQIESYPNMIAQQMKLAGGGDFVQPMMPNNVGGFADLFAASGGKDYYGKLTLQVNNGSLAPTASAPAANLDIIGGGGKKFQNLGVPGAKSFHLLAPGYGNPAGLATLTANPYYVRFATSATSSVLQDAMAQNPTFFSLWIGNNDVLGYATSGGDGSNPITDETTFKTAINTLASTLVSNGAKGVMANIPNVTSIPFFTLIPYKPLAVANFNSAAAGQPSNAVATIQQINTSLLGPLKQALTALGHGDRIQLLSTTENNPVLMTDENLTNLSSSLIPIFIGSGMPPQQAALMANVFGRARHTTSADLIPLSTRSVLGTTPSSPLAIAPLNRFGITFPLEDKHILKGKFGTQTDAQSEVFQVLDATAKFNTIIKQAAMDNNLAFFDANAKMVELAQKSGLTYDGVKYTATFVTGGTFSLDGVHLTGRGYALIANEFIKSINKKYGSTLPLVNPNSFSGVKFP